MTVVEISSKNYKEMISGDEPIVIDHFADWCGPCKLLSPVFDRLSNDYNGRLVFGKVDTEAYPEIAAENSVVSIPCLIVFHKGKEVDRIIGYMNESRLKIEIENVLKKVK